MFFFLTKSTGEVLKFGMAIELFKIISFSGFPWQTIFHCFKPTGKQVFFDEELEQQDDAPAAKPRHC